MTQEHLSRRATVTLSTLRKIETGKVTEPGYFTIMSIVRALGCSLADFEYDLHGS